MDLTFERLAATSILSILAGCGGGGGGGGQSSNAPAAPQSYAVGGNASGVEGTGLVLQINGANDVAASADGPFNFSPLPSGSTYNVTIKTQPSSPAQTCTVANAAGSVTTSAVNNIAVSCRTLVGKFLYVPNTVSNSVSAYSIDAATGATANGPALAVIDIRGRFLYVNHHGNSIAAFSINQTTGVLTPVPGSPFPTEARPSPPVADPSGRYLYVVNRDSSSISSHSINPSTGALALINTLPTGAAPQFARVVGLQ